MRRIMRSRVTFQRRTGTENAFGEVTNDWTDVATVSASIRPISGREFFAAQQAQSDITTDIECNFSSILAGIKADDRVKHLEKIYDIRHGPLDADERHRRLRFMCTLHEGSQP